MALALDSARDDIVYFRRQWFPELCEAGLVPDFGAGRGLVRHPKETAEQFRARVVNAWRWHQLGGRTEGLPEILRFYGFETVRIDNMRQWQPGRWAEFQIGLATPATQAEQQALLADLDTLLWLVNEYKPARSVLARVYTDTYNVQPLIWSQGFWSGDYWSRFSGTAWPGEEGGDDLVVSFGMAHRVMSDPYLTGGWLAALCHTQTHAFRIPYVDRFIWSRSAWSDSILRNHGFVCGQLLSVHWCDLLYESSAWCGPWSPRPWAVNIRWDRRLPAWSMFAQAWSRSQLMYADRPADGGWGDINATWSVPLVTVIGRPPRWGAFAWSEQEPALRHIRVDEQFHDVRGLSTLLFRPEPGTGHAAGVAALRAFHVPYHDRAVWSRTRWSDVFPRGHGFVMRQDMASFAGQAVYAPAAWSGPWPARPWGVVVGYDRPREDWAMVSQAWSRSRLMYADRPADGGWGDINATWSVPVVTVSGRPSRWGAFAWSEQEPALRHIRVDERYRDVRGLSAAPFWPDTGMGTAVMEAAGAGHVVYADRHAWSRSAWSDAFPGNRGFAGSQCMAQLAGELFTRPWGMSITAIQGDE